MAATATESPDTSGPRSPLSAAELSDAFKIDVYDRKGKTQALGELVKGKRSVLIFIRHFWCLNCQAYLRYISKSIPPSSLPPSTQILVIGCGSYQPIEAYAEKSSSAYPIYTDPSLRLHHLFRFKSNLAEGEGGHGQKDYMRDAGSTMARVWGGIKGAMGSLQHLNHVGPKALNGGEVVISADGKCEYIYRMQNTVDHTNVSELAQIIGVECIPPDRDEPVTQPCGDACTAGAK